MRVQEVVDELQQHKEDNNRRFEHMLEMMEKRFQLMETNFREMLTHAPKSVLDANSAETSSQSHHGAPFSSLHVDDSRAVLKFVKTEIPKFEGKEPNTWIFKAALFFRIHHVPDNLKMELVGLRMEGAVADWYQWVFNSGRVNSWEEFTVAVNQRFGPSKYKDVRGVLSKLVQTGCLSEYIADFQKLMNQVSNISDDLLMTFFISGLLPDLQGAIQLRGPSSLHQAMQLAIAYDSHHGELRSSVTHHQKKPFFRSNTVSTMDKPVLGPSLALPAPSSLPVRKLSPEEMQKKRELGICYTCDAKWTTKHRCPAKMLILIGEPEDSEGEGEEEIVWGKPETEGVRVDAALHSLSGHDAKSLVLLAVVKDKKVQVLIDSGSSHNFINKALAEELHLPMLKGTKMRVFMGNGDFLLCDKKCSQVSLFIQGHYFSTDLHVVELTDLSIILGIHWLVSLGRVTQNYSDLSMEFSWQNQKVFLKDIPSQKELATSSSGTAVCNALSLQETAPVSTEVSPDLLLLKNTISVDLWNILVHCQKVFEIPRSLPPFRDMEHAIHLVDASQTVKVKPY
ncbi:uncharacterized protein LOC133296223 [Gastrolobium bilobum]|uniref:uncharacterized protein LOC133296223 n=1 Tax=Gastrolobium bilobum TaxID=150636 RepID=UPI002AB25D55|nr:uncharacterized protein LOC133296223 [Gastrolobium bilobum]